jgi:transposase
MSKTRPPYPAEFRQQMIELVQAGNTPAQLAREFGCSAQTITNWVGQAAADARKKPPTAKDPLNTAEREELARLRRRVRQLEMERDILAKATAWFAGNNDVTSKTSTKS